MNNINIILMSKDRPCQLELLLHSMEVHWSEAFEYKINVLYTFSNNLYKKGYDILIEDYSDVNFIKENNFKEDLLNLIENKPYTIFFVDDLVFKEDFSLNCKEMKLFENQNDILCLSLRLHPNLTYCYAANIPMKKPIFDKNNTWIWKNETGDFNYPMSLDSHIYKTVCIKPYLERLNYSNPNSLEGILATYPLSQPKMICFNKSKVVNNPCNKVQTNNPNRHGNIDAKYLNDKFLEGYRISLDNIDGINNISCHQEIEIKLEKIK